MGNEKMRTFEFNGKKRGIRLDAATWQSLDWLAEQRGCKWSTLVQEWASNAGDDADNLTRVIRSSVLEALMMATICNEQRGIDLDVMEHHAVMRGSGQLDDCGRDELLAGARIQGEQDFGGFKLKFGQDAHGQDFVLIDNAMRDWPHIAFVGGGE